MFKWLARKGENSRVYMCTKELGWELDRAEPLDRAAILAVAQYMRITVLPDVPTAEPMIDRPHDFEREELLALYSMLEESRNRSAQEAVQTKKNMRRMGLQLPEYVEQQTDWTNRALEVWMVTIGAAICPEGRHNVGKIWSLLFAATGLIEPAINVLRENVLRTAELTGQPALAFRDVEEGEWLSECLYVPAAFQRAVAC